MSGLAKCDPRIDRSSDANELFLACTALCVVGLAVEVEIDDVYHILLGDVPNFVEVVIDGHYDLTLVNLPVQSVSNLSSRVSSSLVTVMVTSMESLLV